MRRQSLALLLLILAFAPASGTLAAPRCFPEALAITACIDGRLLAFWEQQGGLPTFGYPLSPAYQDQAGGFTMQRFERQRLELHPENQPPYDVLLGRLGVELLQRRGQDWAAFPKGDPAAPHFFAETGQAITPEFWEYWSSHGLEFDGRRGTSFAESLALFGMPISPAQMEQHPADRQTYLIQWFERARFEYHPEHTGTPYVVQLGLLERELNGEPVVTAPAPPAAGFPDGGFIQVSGAQLTRLGQPVQLKGVNYYPQGRPWKDMWGAWEGPQVERELRLARDQLGINAVRVLVPYTTNREGVIAAELLQQMREMAQIAGNLDLRLIVTLFDFEDAFPPAGSQEEERHLTYLRTLIGNFAGDDRIIAWDLHNEPDNYRTWRDGRPEQVLSWLGRMADEVHRLAPSHLVTVGMANYDNLLRPGPDGRRPIDYSDVISAHIYDPFAVAYQLDVLRLQTGKPIILEEFGWPTELTCLRRINNEEHQRWVYQETLAAAQGRVAGVFAWTLRDYDPGPSWRWDTQEEHYGLYRVDDSLKPAAEEFRAYSAGPALPSIVHTDLPLNAWGPNVPGGEMAPLLIPESGHYVKGWFRLAWEKLGGRGTLGLPLTEAFIQPGPVRARDRVVQFFETGALEFRSEVFADPNFPMLREIDKIRRAIVPIDLGARYVAQHPAPSGDTLAGHFQDAYRSINGSWRLGSAISEAFVEDLNGTPTNVQYFQRGRLQINPATHEVELGGLGRWAWDAQCQSAP